MNQQEQHQANLNLQMELSKEAWKFATSFETSWKEPISWPSLFKVIIASTILLPFIAVKLYSPAGKELSEKLPSLPLSAINIASLIGIFATILLSFLFLRETIFLTKSSIFAFEFKSRFAPWTTSPLDKLFFAYLIDNLH